jgi:hypothetical protein
MKIVHFWLNLLTNLEQNVDQYYLVQYSQAKHESPEGFMIRQNSIHYIGI